MTPSDRGAVTEDRTDANRRVTTRLDRGAVDVLGVVLLAPVMLAFAVVVVFLGRQVDSQAQVRSMAETAAQAAALQRSPAAAVAAARSVVAASAIDADTCATPTVEVDTSRFAPGGSVSVIVGCSVSGRGLELLDGHSAGSVRAVFTARATATIDPFRMTDGAP
jgi:Flp pilus assembly protein TadG